MDEQQFKKEFDELVRDLISSNTNIEVFVGYNLKIGDRDFRVLLEIDEY